MRGDNWTSPTASERNEKTLSEVVKKLDELLFHLRETKSLTFDEVQQIFKDKVLYPYFNKCNAPGYDYLTLQEFLSMLENADFRIVHKYNTDKFVDISMFKAELKDE